MDTETWRPGITEESHPPAGLELKQVVPPRGPFRGRGLTLTPQWPCGGVSRRQVHRGLLAAPTVWRSWARGKEGPLWSWPFAGTLSFHLAISPLRWSCRPHCADKERRLREVHRTAGKWLTQSQLRSARISLRCTLLPPEK